MAIGGDYGASDIDVTMAQRQVGAAQEEFVQFTSVRALTGAADSFFSFGTRALRPSTAASGDRFFAADIGTIGGWLYYWTGTAWEYLAGWASGTDAVRAAISVSSVDNGAWFYTTDTQKFWQVSGGAWTDRTPALSTEAVQDIVGAMMTDSGTVDFSYDDTAGTVTATASTPAPALSVATKSANYTLTDNDDVILVDASGGAVTITLHAVGSAKKKVYHFKKIDSSANAMTLDGNGAETIDGAATQSTTTQYVSFSLVPDGSAWYIV